MIRGGCLATSLPENVDLKQILLIFSQQQNDGVNFLKQEYDEQKNILKYFPIILFPSMQILNKNMGSGRHSLIWRWNWKWTIFGTALTIFLVQKV